MIFALQLPQPCSAPCGTDFSLCSGERGNKFNAATGDSYSIDELYRVFHRSAGLSTLLSNVLTPVFSYSCALFCSVQNHISFIFMRFRTLSPKHPGVGYPKPQIRPSLCDVSLCAAGNTSFSPRHRAHETGKRYDDFVFLAPYLFNHLRSQSASTSRKGSGSRVAVTSHEATRAVECQSKSRDCRTLDAFQGYHAK